MSARTLRAVGDKVLLKPLPAKPVTSGGIMLAENWQTPSGRALIVSVGERVTDTDLKPGAQVFYNWIDGQAMELDGETYRLLRASQILGVEQ